MLRILGFNGLPSVPKKLSQPTQLEEYTQLSDEATSTNTNPPPVGKKTISISDYVDLASNEAVLINNEPDGNLIKENTQKIQALTQEVKNLQIPNNPTKSECDNLRIRINALKENASSLFEACKKWLKGSGTTEIEKAYNEFTQAASQKEFEIKFKYDIQNAHSRLKQSNN